MKLLLIRHAQSANNRRYAETGVDDGRNPDPDITDLGVAQAQALAAKISSDAYPRVTHLYCSLMRRTIQTAAPIADALDLPLVARTDTHEYPGPYSGPFASRVAFAGSPRSVLAGFSPRATLPDEATEDGWYNAELETEETVAQRAATLLRQLRETHRPDDVVAVVSHGWFGSEVLKTALGGAPHTWYHHHNTATSLLEWRAFHVEGEPAARDETVLVWGNRTDHLTPEQITQ